jgi:transposase, IS30 family
MSGSARLGVRGHLPFIYRAAHKGEDLWRYLTAVTSAEGRAGRDPRAIRSKTAPPSTIDRKTSKPAPTLAIGKATSSSASARGPCSSSTNACVTLAARLTGKTAAETISVMLAVFGRINPALRKSVTFDNDTAFAQHTLLRTMRDMATWFCDAYASWQKGGVENANGRLRRWLPRHIDIDRLPWEIDACSPC